MHLKDGDKRDGVYFKKCFRFQKSLLKEHVHNIRVCFVYTKMSRIHLDSHEVPQNAMTKCPIWDSWWDLAQQALCSQPSGKLNPKVWSQNNPDEGSRSCLKRHFSQEHAGNMQELLAQDFSEVKSYFFSMWQHCTKVFTIHCPQRETKIVNNNFEKNVQ